MMRTILLVAIAASTTLLHCTSNKGSGSQTACEELLECCKLLAPELQPQCQAGYDEWHEQPDAQEQCQQAMSAMGTCTSGRDGAADGRSDGGATAGCGAVGKSQTVSQPCCLDYGIDACGANLFCAAFDGRTQPTCYLEYSRKDRETCTEDRQCASRACNTTAGRCKSMPYTACDPAVGCAVAADGKKFACDVRSSSPQCAALPDAGDGAKGAFCVDDVDCASHDCSDNSCKAATGDGCSADTDCAEGNICSYYNSCILGPGRPCSGGLYSADCDGIPDTACIECNSPQYVTCAPGAPAADSQCLVNCGGYVWKVSCN